MWSSWGGRHGVTDGKVDPYLGRPILRPQSVRRGHTAYEVSQARRLERIIDPRSLTRSGRRSLLRGSPGTPLCEFRRHRFPLVSPEPYKSVTSQFARCMGVAAIVGPMPVDSTWVRQQLQAG